MAVSHRSFRHIVNSEVRSYLRKIDSKGSAQVEEKIDGSNFYFATDGKQVIVGRRHDTLGSGENFFEFQNMTGSLDENKRNFEKLYTSLKCNGILYMYGELIPTQKRIKYVPDNKIYFIAFEMGTDVEGTYTVLSRNIWESPASKYGFLVNPILFKGSLDQCLQFDVETTKSVIPKLLGYDHDVCIEGVIIRIGDFVVKKKAKSFCEMAHGKLKTKGDSDPVIQCLNDMLTISRLENIVSQIGDKMLPDGYRLSNTVVLDAISECRDDEDSPIHKISKSKLGKIQKELAALFQEDVEMHMGWNKSGKEEV